MSCGLRLYTHCGKLLLPLFLLFMVKGIKKRRLTAARPTPLRHSMRRISFRSRRMMRFSSLEM